METSAKRSATNRPFANPKYTMETGHQMEIQQDQKSHRDHVDYRMHTEIKCNTSNFVTRTKERSVCTIEDSEDEVMHSETSSNTETIQEVVQETRAETKKRRRQELLDNYDAEPFDPIADGLLEGQIRHYMVLQQRGLVPMQAKAKTRDREDKRSENIEGWMNKVLESNNAPKHRYSHPSVFIPQILAQDRKCKLPHGENGMNTNGKSGSSVTKKGHVAKKRAIISKKDMLELMFKGN